MYQQPQGPGGPPPGFAPPQPPWVQAKAKKKRRIVLILVIVALLALLVGGGVTGGILASKYYKSTGAAPTSTPVPPECEALRPTMERLGVPNVNEVKVTLPSAAATSSKDTSCTWRPTPAEHVRYRSLYVTIKAFTGPDAERQASDYNPPTQGEIVPLPEISDRAWSRIESSGGAHSTAELWARRGKVQVWVMYSAKDKGFFVDERVPADVLSGETKTVAMAVFDSVR
ncbi:hypothetical protein [Amycolatopsis alba]|uniref:DUF3558 domain-containing protein n=2 Tax=Amycolatopsis alba TaxID=76020 RepID=A0A229R8E2_AMYAL|nr:hypothetical protein [Amycolatopsis alba]OXM42907.1 hypothetical protein CFP75_40760 [Amycolatopsis alba DSM 44262]